MCCMYTVPVPYAVKINYLLQLITSTQVHKELLVLLLKLRWLCSDMYVAVISIVVWHPLANTVIANFCVTSINSSDISTVRLYYPFYSFDIATVLVIFYTDLTFPRLVGIPRCLFKLKNQ
jgi:hypothetical protein